VQPVAGEEMMLDRQQTQTVARDSEHLGLVGEHLASSSKEQGVVVSCSGIAPEERLVETAGMHLVVQQRPAAQEHSERFDFDSPAAAAAAAVVAASDTVGVFDVVAEVVAEADAVSLQHCVELGVPPPTAAVFSYLPSALPVCAEA
jgi:hypothetical protein